MNDCVIYSQSETVEKLKAALGKPRRAPVVLCIGSDRVTGDCIGPLVGHLLESRGVDCTVLGSLRAPVTAVNLEETVSLLRKKFAGRKIIAVDSCVGDKCDVGKIRVSRGSLRPGLACGKVLPRVGDVSVTATVAGGSSENLYSVRLSLVFTLAECIAGAIDSAISSIKEAK